MTTVAVPICYFCKHARNEVIDGECDAYPKGIPQIFLQSKKDHFEPHPGDHGIQFEFKKGLPKSVKEIVVSRKPPKPKPKPK